MICPPASLNLSTSPNLSQLIHPPAPQPSQPQPLRSWLLLKLQALFWKELIKTSLSQSLSLMLAIHLYPHHSFFTALIITWHRIFPTLYCVFPSIIVCISFSYILFRVVSLLKKLCSQNQKDTF